MTQELLSHTVCESDAGDRLDRLLAGIADSGALRAAFTADVAAFAPAKKK